MQVTSEFLKAKKACSEAARMFTKFFPEGGHIDAVLTMITLTEEAKSDWVNWLMIKADYSSVEWLDGITVGGSLDLSGTGITSLPDGLTVGGSLDLRGTGITKVPKHLKDKVIRGAR